MNFDFRIISPIAPLLLEMEVDTMATSTLDKKEAMELAEKLLRAAEDLTWILGLSEISEQCDVVAGGLVERIPQERGE